jgi:hypothetical protein
LEHARPPSDDDADIKWGNIFGRSYRNDLNLGRSSAVVRRSMFAIVGEAQQSGLASEKEPLQCGRPEAMIVRQALPRHSPHSLELWIIKDTTEISI